MADVEEDVKRQVEEKIKQLEEDLRMKETRIEQLTNKDYNCEDFSQQTEEDDVKKDVNDNEVENVSNPDEDQLEGSGEKSLVNTNCPKLLRLQSIQDQAKHELKKCDLTLAVHEENSYLVDRMKQLENLLEDMAQSNQEVIDEAASNAEDSRIRVS